MLKKILCLVLILPTLVFLLTSCGGSKKEESADPTIEISDDGYWVINGEKTKFLAAVQEKEHVVGDEYLFENGEEFSAKIYNSNEFAKIKAKMVVKEKYTLDDPSNWPLKNYFKYSYTYRIYVTGYAPVSYAGKECNFTLLFRVVHSENFSYEPRENYESTTIGEDGYFEFSVDVHMPDTVTKATPMGLAFWSGSSYT